MTEVTVTEETPAITEVKHFVLDENGNPVEVQVTPDGIVQDASFTDQPEA